MAKHTIYHVGGWLPDALAQNIAQECDDDTRICTTWDADGNLLDSRSYTEDENTAADAYAAQEATAELVTVQVDPEAVAAALTAAGKATTVAALRSAVIALGQQLQPTNGN